MQHKWLILSGLVIVFVIGWLMSADITAPQQPIEKPLDAQTFIEKKPE
jgi:hypothetical protein